MILANAPHSLKNGKIELLYGFAQINFLRKISKEIDDEKN